ncbi:hypothetical protein ONE63_000880 [Megalurothrips usitatus]|uniref:NF-kappa-B-repressing factor n=1 Tax=Megalurothrips usitatus TaxID=439358 RepID=A0AAV7Y2E1_9NEOP|nr:hypothetical protein ONE63_000880 [Megalurothrips usitatus]
MMGAFTILDRSLRGSNRHFKTVHKKIGKQDECTMFVDNEILATALGENPKKAQQQCAALGLARLKKICHTLLVKDNLAGATVDKSEDGSIDKIKTNSGESNEISNAVPEHLAEDSKVSRMMKLMGWGGKGLGKDQQGRTEPVQAANVVKRAGLGLVSEGGGSGPNMRNSSQNFNRCIRKLLNEFKSSLSSENLVFAADFSKEERKTIHLMARNMGVKSQSYGNGDDRRLVLRKSVSYQQILEEVKEAGGSTAKYDLLPPEEN